MRSMLTTIILLIFIFLATCVNQVFSIPCRAGVNKGDYFYYETYGVYTSNFPSVTLSIPAFEYNTTNWVRIEISEVQGSQVYQVYTLSFKNGSETTFNLVADLNPKNEKSLSFDQKGIPMCAADLKAGDTLPSVPLVITKTVTLCFPSGSRTANVVTWNFTSDWGRCYFDKATGTLVKLFHVHRFVDLSSGEIVQKTDVINLINTNRWQVSGYRQSSSVLDSFPLVGVFASATAIFAYTLLFKRISNPRKSKIKN